MEQEKGIDVIVWSVGTMNNSSPCAEKVAQIDYSDRSVVQPDHSNEAR